MPKRTPPVRRSHFLTLTAFLGVWVALITGRLVQLQVFEHDAFAQRARRQQQQTVEISPVRGIIYDRNLRPLAMSVEVESIFAVPAEVTEPEATARLLAPVLKMRERELRKKLQAQKSFVWIQRKVSARDAARVRQLDLKGIHFQKETKRFYPKRELAAHVLGHVGVDDQGLAGIELRYDEAIRGAPGELLIQRDARRRWFGRTGKPPTPGEDLVLTIDETIQSIAERELDAVMAASRALSGSVVVEDPHTGEILAMANRPTFNPNTYAETSEAAQRNLAVSGIYEPGSTFKIITMASALEEGLTSPGEPVDCQMGSISVFGHTIRDHRPFGILTVAQAFENSSDVCTIKIALRLGNGGLYQYLRRFGFGSPTGIELPGEARGLTKPPERWWKASIGAIAMGQEIGVTPLQVLAAASTVANDGVWVRPRVVLGTSRAGLPPASPVREVHRVISPRTAALMQDMMVKVITAGTGKTALPKGYSAGGKTGTAQKLDPLTKTYSVRDYVASFVGFAPAEDPLVTILVVLDSPRGKYHGGDVAAPVFRAVAEQVLAYRNVLPSAPQALPLSLASWREPAAQPDEEGLAEGGSTVPFETQPSWIVPDFLGQSVRAITAQAAARGLPIQIVGYGVAYEQSPLPGMLLQEGQTIVVRFTTGLPANRPPRRREAPGARAPGPPRPSARAVSSPASG